MQRVVISVPRILAWVKRQPPERVIGVTGNAHSCAVARFAKDEYGLAYVRVQPSRRIYREGHEKITYATESLQTTRPISPNVNRLALWFDRIREGSTGQEITAGEFLTKWQARDE